MQKLVFPLAALVVLGIGISPAFAEMHVTSKGVDDRGVKFTFISYDCRAMGHGELRYSVFPEYVYVEFTKIVGSESTLTSRTFSMDDYMYVISPYYVTLLNHDPENC